MSGSIVGRQLDVKSRPALNPETQSRSLYARVRRLARRGPRYIAGRLLADARRRALRPWTLVYPRLLSERALLAAASAQSVDQWWDTLQAQPFFLSPSNRPEWMASFESRFAAERKQVLVAADRVLEHRFDLLGSTPVTLGPRLPWHVDFKTGKRWPLSYACDLEFLDLDRPTDVKVPWELSRCQHFATLGQAWWLTGDDRHAREFVDEVTDWIAENPWGYGVNWVCAMDVALRAVSWIWAFYYMADAPACRNRRFRTAFLRSLFLHGEHVATHLERGPVNGNHYLCDGVGLVFLGIFFRGTRKGQAWLDTGRAIVLGELPLQVSADGVDFEQSTAYHRLVLEAFSTALLLLRTTGEVVPVDAWRRLEHMFDFVEAYTKPDGSIPLVGDADDGRVQKLGTQQVNDHRYLLSTGAAIFERHDLKQAAGRFHDESFWLLGPDGAARFDALGAVPPPAGVRAFPRGGFFTLRTERVHLFVDGGEVGMLGRGGHGHNDVLSFELWMDGANLVTDCGAYLYTASREWRNRFRSTAFHNVVQVDGEELNRFVAPDALWQLHYDAVPEGIAWRSDAQGLHWQGSHRGYERLSRPVRVTREFHVAAAAAVVVIRDTVSGEGVRRLTWRFHLDPAVRSERAGDGVRLTAGAREFRLEPLDGTGLSLRVEEGWVSPSYGVRTACGVVVFEGDVILPKIATFTFSAMGATA